MRRLSLAIALLALASFARAESLRVVAPANGATLRGGSFAELRWTSAQLPAGAEEWEAFLSVDGGKYYAFRVRPHLDIQLRKFTFVAYPPIVPPRHGPVAHRGIQLLNHGNYLGRGQTVYGDAATPNPTFGQLVAVGTSTNAIPAFANVDPPRVFQVQVRFVF